MNPLRLTVPAFTALALLAPARAQEKTESTLVIDIPAAVQATIQKEKGDGKVVEFRRANENGLVPVSLPHISTPRRRRSVRLPSSTRRSTRASIVDSRIDLFTSCRS